MDREVKFRWRQRPPKQVAANHKWLAARLLKCLQKELLSRPWRNSLKVAVGDEKPCDVDGGMPLAMWVVLPNSVDAFWAASLMTLIHRKIPAVEPRVCRVAITAPKEPVTGYAPLVSWRFYGSDNRAKTIRDSEIQGFLRHLSWCASGASEQRGAGREDIDLLMHTASSPGIQWEAVHALVHHASRQGYLMCSPDEALSQLAAAEHARQPEWTGTHVLTRWKAVKTLVDLELLDGFVGGQRPLRPVGSTVHLNAVRSFVATACQLEPADLTGPDRRANILHGRYLAAAVMRRVTSRSLFEIGRCLGGRDHATIINGLDRIEEWRRLDPMHAWMIETFAQIADNMGILKVPALRQMATRQLAAEFQGLDTTSPRKEGLTSGARRNNAIGDEASNVISLPLRSMQKPIR